MLALDHIVISVKDAEEASNHYCKQFSLKAVKGGRHEDWGTSNYLAYFSNNSYLEWLEIHDYEQARKTDHPLMHHFIHIQEKSDDAIPFQFALRTNELDEYITHFQEQQIPFKGPIIGRRRKPDGSLLKWRMLFPEYDVEQETLPFLIEWEIPNKNLGLDNSLNISQIQFGGTSKDKFTHIYRVKRRQIYKQTIRLYHTEIHFTKQRRFSFTIQ